MVNIRGRDEWNAAKARGLNRYVAVAAVRRAIPMSIAVLLLLEILDGGGFTRERLLSADFAERVLFVFAVFFVGGVISAFARWKSFESLYDEDDST